MQEGCTYRRPQRRRWLTLAGLVLAVALVSPARADAPPANPSPSGNAEDAGIYAPVATLTADHAVKADVRTQPVLKTPSVKAPFHDRPTIDLNTYKAAKRAIVRGAKRTGTGAAPVPALPVNLGGFNGITQATAQSTWPSDINGAVSHGGFSDGYNVQVVNQHYTAWRKATAPGGALCDMSYATRTGNNVNSLFDPRVEYDQYWQRFVDEVESDGASQHQYLMVSFGRNPCDGYWIYDLGGINGFCPAPTGGPFWDYPQISLTQDAVIVTANCFDNTAYRGALTFAVAKAKLYNGLGFSVPIFGPFCGTTTPPRVIDGNPRAHMLARCAGIHDIQFRNPQADYYGAVPSDTVVAGLTPAVPPSAGQIGCGAMSCTVDTSDGRYINPPTQYGDHLWAVATWTDAGLPTPFWHDIDTEGAGADTLKQAGEVFISACGADYMASIAATAGGTAWVNWSQSQDPGCGGGTTIRMAAASRLAGDAANTMPLLGIVNTSCCELTGNFDPNFGTQRWGDTSSVSVDPSAGDRAWLWNGSAASSALWGTRSQLVRNP